MNDSNQNQPKKSGLKIQNPPHEKKQNPLEKLSQEAEQFLSKKEELKNAVQKLTIDFLSILNKKTIKSDLGPKEIESEKKLIDDIINTANIINEDPDFPEGFGSLMVNAICLQTSLRFRDRLNSIELAVRKTISSLDLINQEVAKLKNLQNGS